MAVVKTYRALREQQVGGQRRGYGDFIPEAADWSYHVLSTYLRSEFIEATYVDAEELEEALRVQRANDGVLEEASSDADPLPSVDDEEEESDTSDDPEDADEPDDEGETPKLKLKKKGKN